MCKLIIKDRKVFCEQHGKYFSNEPIYRMNDSGIYKIGIKDTNFFYIGYASHFAKRFRQHKVNLKSGKHCNWKMQWLVNMLGIDILEFFILEFHEDCRVSSYNLEALYINTLNPELNIAKPAKDRHIWIRRENVKMNPAHC